MVTNYVVPLGQKTKDRNVSVDCWQASEIYYSLVSLICFPRLGQTYLPLGYRNQVRTYGCQIWAHSESDWYHIMGENPRLFKIRFQYIVANWVKMYCNLILKKVHHLSLSDPLWVQIWHPCLKIFSTNGIFVGATENTWRQNTTKSCTLCIQIIINNNRP